MCCCVYILNFIVKDGFKVIEKFIVKIRDSVKYVNLLEVRRIKLRKCVVDVGL